MNLTLNFVEVFKNISLYAILYRSMIIIYVVEIIDSFSNPASFPHLQSLEVQWMHAFPCVWVIETEDVFSPFLQSLIPDKAQFCLIFSMSAVCKAYLIWVMSLTSFSSSYFPLSLTVYK